VGGVVSRDTPLSRFTGGEPSRHNRSPALVTACIGTRQAAAEMDPQRRRAVYTRILAATDTPKAMKSKSHLELARARLGAVADWLAERATFASERDLAGIRPELPRPAVQGVLGR